MIVAVEDGIGLYECTPLYVHVAAAIFEPMPGRTALSTSGHQKNTAQPRR